MAVTIRDVAAEAQVSVATVSRITSDTGYPVGRATRERVLAAIDKLGYRPSEVAKGLSVRGSTLIGVLAPDMANQYYAEITRGIEDVAHAEGYQVVFCSSDREPIRAAAYVDSLVRRRVAGLVVVGGGSEVELSPRDVTPYEAAVVMVGRSSEEFSTVQADNEHAGRALAEHFADRGHRRLGYIAGLQESAASEVRYAAIVAELEARGIPAPVLLRGAYTEAGGYEAGRQLLEAAERPTGIIAANDRMAIGALAAAHDVGLSVPADLALAGFDNTPISKYVRPALTTFSLSSRDMGAHAMRLILAGKEEASTIQHVTVRGELVVRESCGP